MKPGAADKKRKQYEERPRLELPLPPPDYKPEVKKPEEPQRGVIYIQVWQEG